MTRHLRQERARQSAKKLGDRPSKDRQEIFWSPIIASSNPIYWVKQFPAMPIHQDLGRNERKLLPLPAPNPIRDIACHAIGRAVDRCANGAGIGRNPGFAGLKPAGAGAAGIVDPDRIKPHHHCRSARIITHVDQAAPQAYRGKRHGFIIIKHQRVPTRAQGFTQQTAEQARWLFHPECVFEIGQFGIRHRHRNTQHIQFGRSVEA